MNDDYDFARVKRAYEEMARRAREKDEVRRPARGPAAQQAPRRDAPDPRNEAS